MVEKKSQIGLFYPVNIAKRYESGDAWCRYEEIYGTFNYYDTFKKRNLLLPLAKRAKHINEIFNFEIENQSCNPY